MAMTNQSDLERQVKQHSVALLRSLGFANPQALLREAASLSMHPDTISAFHARHFTRPDGSIDTARQEGFAKVHTIGRTLSTYTDTLQDRAAETDTHAQEQELLALVANMKAAGMSLDQTVQFFNKHLKIAPALTPHPTENLAPEGVALLKTLVETAELPQAKRAAALKKAVVDIFASDTFGAVSKASILDESAQAKTYKLEHIKAANAFDRTLEGVIERVYGTRPSISTNTAKRDWQYDADGKDNADGFAMIAQLSGEQHSAFDLALSTLSPVLADKNCPQSVKDLAAKYAAMKDALTDIISTSSDVTQALAKMDPDDRPAYYKTAYETHFKTLEDKLSQIYGAIGDTKRGLNLYRESCKILEAERANTALSGDSQNALDETFRTIQRHGFGLSKGQTRHNYFVYMQMLDNLFQQAPLDPLLGDILSVEEQSDIASAGAFSGLPDARQQELRQSLLDNLDTPERRAAFITALEKANPMEFGKTGYPLQTRSMIDRLRLRGLHPLLFEEALISDAGPHAFEIQDFYAQVFDIPQMKHMPLFEDLVNFVRSNEIVDKFDKAGGRRTIERRMNSFPDGVGTGFNGYSVIIPASDSGKEGGDGARLQALIQYRKLVRTAIAIGKPIQIMLGGGLSLNRFGGDVGILRRIIAQELKDHAVKRGTPYDLSNSQDMDLMRMAFSMLYTEQGRANRIYSLTQNQITDSMMGRSIEMIQDMLDLTGAVPDYSYIDEITPLNDKQQKIFETVARRKMDRHFALRHTYPVGGKTKILDSIADKTRCPGLIPYTNIMSRAAAKTKDRGMTDERAIGNDISQGAAELFLSGFYGTGGILHERFQNIKNRKESAADLHAVLDHPEMEYGIIVPGLANAARFNATYLFSKVSDKQWTPAKIMALGASARTFKNITEGRTEMAYTHASPDYTPEEAYLAKAYYDRVLFFALTEASLETTLNTDVDSIVTAYVAQYATGLDIRVGDKTLKRYPAVGEILNDHKKNAPGYALMRGAQDALTPETPPENLFQIAAAYRSGTLSHRPFWGADRRRGLNLGTTNRRAAGTVSFKIAPELERPEPAV